MNARATDVAVKPASGNCGCGCCSECRCESRCCELECLVRPNFFCGQLLTDADLGAMVDWARGRFGLARYRHGWGIACGLEVTCTQGTSAGGCCDDRNGGPSVWVQPGYALDCCGNDLVVCEPLRVDLTAICQPTDDPCEGTPAQQLPAPGRSDGPCLDRLKSGLVAVDLKLRYHEDLASGQRPMFQGACRDVGACEYTRVLEKPCVHLEIDNAPVPCGEDRDQARWYSEFVDRQRGQLRRIRELIGGNAESVVRYLRSHPPHRFCFLEDVVCCTLEPQSQTPTAWDGELPAQVGVWLYLDWLLHEIECACASCRPDRGVPIARVLLSRRAANDATVTCKVVYIDASVPHRRRLQRDDCWPLPRGSISLALYLGHPEAQLDELRRLGIDVDVEQSANSTRAMQLFDDQALVIRPDEMRGKWIASTLEDPFRCRRVTGIRRA